MKRLSMAMTALAVLGLMTMVSCRKPNVNNVVPGAARTVTFNAVTESGNGSKTYLDGPYVKWSEDDVIYVNGTGTGNKLTLASEPGSTFGSFSSQNFTATTPYMVGYPYPTAISQSEITFTISDNQSGDDASLTDVLPMAAYTTDENADLQFKNMVNVLKLDLTGSETINKIEVESAAENLSGSFTVGTGLTPNRITSGTKTITVTTDMTLTGTPQTVYVVLPVFGSAESTVTVKFTGTAGVMTVGPKALKGSDTPNHRYKAAVAVTLVSPPVETDEWINFNDKAMGVTGLPIWSKYNLGVDRSDLDHAYDWYGDYYAWGEVAPYYKGITWTSATSYSVTEWCAHPSHNSSITFDNSVGYGWKNYIDGTHTSWSTDYEWNPTPYRIDKVLTQERDAAYQNATPANTWRMPTVRWDGEWQQLASNTYFKWVYGYNGIDNLNGFVVYKVKDAADKGLMTKDDNENPNNPSWKTYNQAGVQAPVHGEYTLADPHMFLPAAGYRYGTSLFTAGSYGDYWSSSLNSSSPSNAYNMYFSSGYVDPQGYNGRYYGFTVRPVR